VSSESDYRTGAPDSGLVRGQVEPLRSERLASGRESPLSAELRAVGRAAGEGFGGLVDRVEETHRAVSERAFGAVGTVAAPVKRVHDAVAGVAYGSTRVIGRRGLRLGGVLAARAVPAGLPGAEQRTSTRVLKGALNGMYGDRFEADGNGLAIEMTPLVRGLPRARVAVFLHGLCETEDAWFLHEERCPAYGSRLRDELGYTPVYIRYNSGLDVDTNGMRLALLMEQFFGIWPTAISEIVLIGHSMGGLVARSACSIATEGDGLRWAGLLKHLIALGTPHRGAPLEQTAEVAARVLSWAPETRGLSALIDSRSAGIKDLGTRLTLPYTPGVSHHFYSAGLRSAGVGGGVSETVLGDLLVPRPSAWDIGRREKVAFGAGHYRHLEGASHFDLLGHPAVSDQIVRWLGVAELTASG
jgi:pimeloyl-ACP methyl ester carboxylesterase